MKILFWIALSLLALAQGRDYCLSGDTCATDFDCLQQDGGGDVYGWCCNNKCTTSFKFLARGAACNYSMPCMGICSGDDDCTNGICQGSGVTEGCDCTTLGFECNSASLGAGSTIPNTCQADLKCMMPLPRDAACSTDASCANGLLGGCYQGKCLGSNLALGASCRLASECSGNYQCLNGKCAYKTLGMSCTGSSECDSSVRYCNNTFLVAGQCLARVSVGGNCTSTGMCVSSAYCPYSTTCVSKLGAGALCNSTMPCLSNNYCMNYNFGVSKCVPYYSIPNYEYCTSSIVCPSGSSCARYGANTTASFCIPYYSLKAGENCSSTNSCPKYGLCSLGKCTASYLNTPCDYNSSASDFSQCFVSSLACSCNDKCEVYTSNSRYCGNYVVPVGDPTKMNQADKKSFANAYCCSLCLNPLYVSSLSTSTTGFQIDCDSLSITAKPVCNDTSGGSQLFLNCDDWSAAPLGSAVSFSLLGFLFASLFVYLN